MKDKRLKFLLVLVLSFTLLLSACAQPTSEPVVEEVEGEEEVAVEEVEEPEPAEEAAEEMGLPDLGGQEVTIAVENAYLPFNYIDPGTGEPAGWDYEVWDAICEAINCTPKYVEAAWEGMIQAVADGQFDAAADGITITEERDEIVDFSIGYVAIEQRLLVRVDEDRIESIEDIVADEELKLGTQTGTTNYETASQYLDEERIAAFEQFPFAVQAVIAGDIDAVIIDEVAGQGYLGENADALKLVGPSLSSDHLGFIFPSGSELVEPVNAGLEELMKNGFLEEVNAKYFGPDFDITYDDLFPPEEEETSTMAEDLEIVDGLGRSVIVELPIERIVSLAPSNTEILYAVGADEMVVGVTEYCNYPEAALAVDKIGGFSASSISVETIVSLTPDLVLAYGDRQGEIIAALEAVDIAVLALNPSTFEDVYENISLVGQLTGNQSKAQAVVDDMRSRINAVAEVANAIPEEEKVKVFWEIFNEPLMTTGPSTYIGQMLTLAGGINIFGELQEAYPQINAEEVVARNPQAIMGSDSHGDKLTPDQVSARPGWDQIDAAQNGRILLIPGDIVSRAGPRLADAVEAIAQALYPDLFE